MKKTIKNIFNFILKIFKKNKKEKNKNLKPPDDIYPLY